MNTVMNIRCDDPTRSRASHVVPSPEPPPVFFRVSRAQFKLSSLTSLLQYKNLMNEHAGPLTTGERWKTTMKYIWPNIVRNIYRGMSQTTGENGPNNNRRNDDV